MKCPCCTCEDVIDTEKGYFHCKACESYIVYKMKDDPKLQFHKYKFEMFRCRSLGIEEAFAIARKKFQNDKMEVVAITLDRTRSRSILFGYPFVCVRRVRKIRLNNSKL